VKDRRFNANSLIYSDSEVIKCAGTICICADLRASTWRTPHRVSRWQGEH